MTAAASASAFERATVIGGGGTAGTSTIDASWYQGRGAFGGVLAALLVRAMERAVADDARGLRSLTVHFCGPATEGPVSVTSEIVRAGSRVTHATARIMRSGETLTFATASFCRERPGASYALASMPDVPPATGLGDFPRGVPGVPVFLQHLDLRLTGDTFPFSGANTPAFSAWVRLREPAPVDAAVAALLLDSLPPGISTTFDAPRPIASVDFRVQLFAPLPASASSPEDFHLVTVRSRWADGGYTEELRELWSPAGVLLAHCQQLIAIL